MAVTVLPTDLFVQGNVASTTLTIPASTVADTAVSATADIAATKVRHVHRVTYGQASGSASASATQPVHVVHGTTSTLVAFKAGSVTACAGAATITVDLKKNGTSVLSSVITLDNANTARVVEAGTVTTSTGTAGDVYEIVVVATAGGGTLGNGVFAYAEFYETAL